jgi:hypothetical protein
LEAGLEHPAFDAVRPWFQRLRERSLEELNALAAERGLATESGRPVRFVPPAQADPYYEVHLHQTGAVHTRADSWHDLFNALVWLAFPLTKARINALHAATIPREGGVRGAFRDLLTIFDEGGAIQTRAGVTVFGHATMEQALSPRPGITCKVMHAFAGTDLDAQASAQLAVLAPHGTPRHLPTRPVFRDGGWVRA